MPSTAIARRAPSRPSGSPPSVLSMRRPRSSSPSARPVTLSSHGYAFRRTRSASTPAGPPPTARTLTAPSWMPSSLRHARSSPRPRQPASTPSAPPSAYLRKAEAKASRMTYSTGARACDALRGLVLFPGARADKAAELTLRYIEAGGKPTPCRRCCGSPDYRPAGRVRRRTSPMLATRAATPIRRASG